MLPVDVWIDGDNLVRRQQRQIQRDRRRARSAFDITTDYTAYGAKLDAQPPADGEARSTGWQR